MDDKKLLVIALGGNALLEDNVEGTIEDREYSAHKTAELLIPILKSDYDLIITHGNGPQVGNILIQNEEAASKVPALPLDVCVAESQGEIGYVLQKAIQNCLNRNEIKKSILTVLTQVLVDKSDSGFSNPTKPIGPFYDKQHAVEIYKTKKWIFKEDAAGRGYRRVVPSPHPIKVIQDKVIMDLTKDGHIVIAVGGGGIPIYYSDKGELEGIEAVIDKDLASARLAIDLKADKLIILTNVDACYINFKKPDEIKLTELNLDEATTYFEQGHFPPGSMGPKITAAIDFVVNTGNSAIITSIEKLPEALTLGKSGTRIHQ
ncbi:MAG: carbamate kinase [Ignavibacteria bacterium]|nr:carbamate kinase [Ignavibacteria bacterium]